MRILASCALILVGIAFVVRANESFSRRLAEVLTRAIKQSGESRQASEPEIASFLDEEKVALRRAPSIKAGDESPVVSTTSGAVTGTSEANVHSFFEIPYVEPPVGELRFQPPQPIQTPKAIDATENNELQCMQFERNCVLPQSQILCNRLNMKEDCLVLNVYVPIHVNLSDSNRPPVDRLPVMFYIHGGSFNGGNGHGMDGRQLAYAVNVILVTLNYRLGPFGFLVNKEAGKPDIDGNQGIKDQQMALKWVHDNIANFGGDEKKVTIFGGSAGAQSIMFHTLSVNSAPYYLQAIQQSAPMYIGFDTPEESQRITNSLAKRLCNETKSRYDCLMNSDPIAIANRQLPVMARNFFASDLSGLAEPYRPVIDGVEFTGQPLDLYKQGKWNSNKNMIVGIQTQELEDIQFYIPEVFPTGEAAFTIATYYVVGIDTTDKVVKKYSEKYSPEDGNYIVMFGKEMTHMFFICPSRAMARFAAQTASGDAKIYFYANEHPVVDGTCRSRNNGSEEGCYYATHDDETRFVLRRLSNPSEPDRQVQDMFNTYWGSFARTGTPSNGLETSLGGFTEWPKYAPGLSTPENEEGNASWQNIHIKAPMSQVETGYEEDICDFWDSLGVYMDPIPLATTTTTTTRQTLTDPPLENTTSDARFLTGISVLALLIPLLATKISI